MAEYIEREALLKRLEKHQAQDRKTIGKKQFAEGYYLGLTEAEIMVAQAPTIDAVEVVRCKDCALRDTAACTMTYDFLTGEPLKDRSFSDDDDFCSYGERRSNAEE